MIVANPLQIFVDIQNRKLVQSPADSTSVRWPTLVQGETVPIQIVWQQPTGDLTTPFNPVDYSGGACKVAIISGDPTGGADTAIVFQDTWTGTTIFSASLNISTVGVSNALGTAASLTGTVEIEITPAASTPVKVFQGSATIKSAVIDSASAVPVPVSSYYTAAETLATFVKKIGLAGETVMFTSPNGLWGRILGVRDDGSGQDDIIAL